MFLLLASAFGLTFSWAGKKEMFRGPLGWIARRLGGIAVDRSGPADLVSQVAEEFRRRDALRFVLAPSGTRSRTDYWKSGFYHIALAARVPVVLGILDYAKREGGFGPVLRLTGDVRGDMETIRSFYAGVTPYRPENAGPIRLRSEGGPGESPREARTRGTEPSEL